MIFLLFLKSNIFTIVLQTDFSNSGCYPIAIHGYTELLPNISIHVVLLNFIHPFSDTGTESDCFNTKDRNDR